MRVLSNLAFFRAAASRLYTVQVRFHHSSSISKLCCSRARAYTGISISAQRSSTAQHQITLCSKITFECKILKKINFENFLAQQNVVISYVTFIFFSLKVAINALFILTHVELAARNDHKCARICSECIQNKSSPRADEEV
jgi:hypothetical protein